jgi:hypothetical protein
MSGSGQLRSVAEVVVYPGYTFSRARLKAERSAPGLQAPLHVRRVHGDAEIPAQVGLASTLSSP